MSVVLGKNSECNVPRLQPSGMTEPDREARHRRGHLHDLWEASPRAWLVHIPSPELASLGRSTCYRTYQAASLD
jgi:hypothetical protein